METIEELPPFSRHIVERLKYALEHPLPILKDPLTVAEMAPFTDRYANEGFLFLLSIMVEQLPEGVFWNCGVYSIVTDEGPPIPLAGWTEHQIETAVDMLSRVLSLVGPEACEIVRRRTQMGLHFVKPLHEKELRRAKQVLVVNQLLTQQQKTDAPRS